MSRVDEGGDKFHICPVMAIEDQFGVADAKNNFIANVRQGEGFLWDYSGLIMSDFGFAKFGLFNVLGLR